jgi:hypothetical protein
MRCLHSIFTSTWWVKNKHQVVAGYQDLFLISVEASAGCDSSIRQ